MNMTKNIFLFAEKIKIFSKLGATLHSTLSLMSLLSFGVIMLPNTYEAGKFMFNASKTRMTTFIASKLMLKKDKSPNCRSILV